MHAEKGSTKGGGGVLPFLAGLVVALVVGWWGYPAILYSHQAQPLEFNHKAHTQGLGMACEDCHRFRGDGSFAGFPSTESCAECHNEPTKKSKAIDAFVTEYAKKNKDVPWVKVYYQPDNAFFTHKPHEAFACTECHADIGSSEKAPVAVKNRLTGYSKETTGTMKMWQCERCHAEVGQSNGCHVCHR